MAGLSTGMWDPRQNQSKKKGERKLNPARPSGVSPKLLSIQATMNHRGSIADDL
jgi:hypothetical protein